jgi:hypothetical protein
MTTRSGAWRPRDPAPQFQRDGHSERAVEAAVVGWQGLSNEERDSATIAALVLADLSLLGAPPEVLGAAARVVEDEVRHVEVCDSVIRELGGVSSAASPRSRDVSDSGSRAARVARILVAGFVSGEPLSAACFAAARQRVSQPLIRWAYTELLRDEVRHGAFGALAAEWVMRGWTAEARRALWPACLAEMEAFESRAGGAATDPSPFHRECEALGMVPRAVAQEAIVKAIPRWVLPRLAGLGVIEEFRG